MNCQHCGKFFKDRPSDHRKFCSQQCTYAARWPKPVWYSEAVNLYNEGWSTIKLAERFNSNHGTISGWLKRDGLTRPLGERRPNKQFACKTCGKLFSGRDGRTRIYKYCSHACCYEDARKRTEWYPQAVELYLGGIGVKRLGKRFGVKPGTILQWLKKDGHFIKGREKGPRWNKGSADTDRMVMDGYRKEQARISRFDETRHWGNHPCFRSFAALRYYNSLPKHQRQEKSRRAYETRKIQPDYRVKVNTWRSQYIKKNPQFKARKNLGVRLNLAVREYGKGSKKHGSVTKYIGCTVAFLVRHIESQFQGRMSWNNYGRSWHIDHIIPCSAFNHASESEILLAWNWQNLRPMWAKQNLLKSATITNPQQALPLAMHA